MTRSSTFGFVRPEILFQEFLTPDVRTSGHGFSSSDVFSLALALIFMIDVGIFSFDRANAGSLSVGVGGENKDPKAEWKPTQ